MCIYCRDCNPSALNKSRRQCHCWTAAYLFNLAGLGDPQIISDTAMPPEQLQLVVQRIDAPAYVLNKFWDVVAWNAAAETLFDIWLKSDTSSRNLLNFMFIHPAAKQLIENWEQRARRVVAEFRADCGWRIQQPELVNFVSGLQAASAEFKLLWETQDVMEREGGERAFHHHQLGNCLFNHVTLRFACDMEHKLVMLMPLIQRHQWRRRYFLQMAKFFLLRSLLDK